MNNYLISRSALMDLFDAKAFDALELFDGGMTRKTWLEAFEAVENAPAVDAEPVRHGRWIDMQEDEITEGMWHCSVCGSDRYFDILSPLECGCHYCPNCGAKMDAEVNG